MPNLQVVSGSDANEPNAMQIDSPFFDSHAPFLWGRIAANSLVWLKGLASLFVNTCTSRGRKMEYHVIVFNFHAFIIQHSLAAL